MTTPPEELLLAKREACEAPDNHILTGLADDVVHEFPDGDLVVFYPWLLQQRMLGELFLELAFDDLLAQPLGTLLDIGILHQLLAGLRHESLGHVTQRDIPRIGSGYLQHQLASQLLELVAARNEVGAAVELKQHPQIAAVVDVRLDQALARLPILGLHLFRAGLPLLLDQLNRLVERARAVQCALAISKACSRNLTQLGNIFCTEFHRSHRSYVLTTLFRRIRPRPCLAAEHIGGHYTTTQYVPG